MIKSIANKLKDFKVSAKAKATGAVLGGLMLIGAYGAASTAAATPITTTSADGRYEITYNWDDLNDLFSYSVRNTDTSYDSLRSAWDVWFDSAFGLNVNTSPINWSGYEASNPNASEKIGANTSSLGDEIWAGTTRNFSDMVDPSFNLDDLTSGLLLNIRMDAYTTQADLYAPNEVINGPAIVPEPASAILFGIGAAGLGYARRKKLFGEDKRDVYKKQ